jgi:hypothetical protein
MLTLIDTLPTDMYDDFTFFHRRLLKINATFIFSYRTFFNKERLSSQYQLSAKCDQHICQVCSFFHCTVQN